MNNFKTFSAVLRVTIVLSCAGCFLAMIGYKPSVHSEWMKGFIENWIRVNFFGVIIFILLCIKRN
jgi:hypothetical protein